MRILVTGATGYIGGAVAAWLRLEGHDVVGTARDARARRTLASAGYRTVHADLDDPTSLAPATADVDAVVDAAAGDHHDSTRAFLEALEGTGKVFVRTSGTGVYADRARGDIRYVVHTEDDDYEPLDEIAARWRTDVLVQEATARGVHTVVLRPPLVYGRGGSLHLPVLLRAALRHGFAGYTGNGLNRCATAFLDDIAQAFSLALTHAPSGSVYNLEDGEEDLKTIAQAIGRLLGVPARPFADDDEAARVLGADWAVGLACNSRVDSSLARFELGWDPVGPALLDELSAGSYRRVWGERSLGRAPLEMS